MDKSEFNLLCLPLYPSIYQGEGPYYLPFSRNLGIKEPDLSNPSSLGILTLSSDKVSKSIMGEVTNFYLLLDSHESKDARLAFVTCVFSTEDCLTNSLPKRIAETLRSITEKGNQKQGRHLAVIAVI